MVFMWTVILGVIAVICETNGLPELAIFFATLSFVGLLVSLYQVMESTL